MDNGQMPMGGMPPVQPGQPMPPIQPIQPAGLSTPGQPMVGQPMMGQPMPGVGQPAPMPGQPGVGQPLQPGQPIQPGQPMPMVQQVQVMPEQKKDIAGLVKTIVIIAVSLIAVTFIGLFIWMSVQYNDVQSDVQGRIDVAVAAAKDEQATKMEAEFLEREKYPYKTFSGPVDYGQLTFEYPKTWSVYVAASATDGGDFNAYFNPIQVDTVSENTINALRVTIKNESFDDVTEKYKKDMEKKDANLTMQATTIGKNGNIAANRYTGKIPKTELSGIIVTFKIRDKTAIMQTDSMLFQAEFDKLLGTVVFNE